MDKKKATNTKRVSMTDLVGATKQVTRPTPTKATSTPGPTPGRKVREMRPNDKVINVSTAIRESELAELQAYADKRSATRGSLITALMRHAMRDLRAERVKLKVEALKFVSVE